MTSLLLPDEHGQLTAYELSEPRDWRRPTRPLASRIAYAAAHVVPRALGENTPGSVADIDWAETLAFRRHLWSWGLGVAEAMDTAQRGMGLDWPAARELIQRSAAEAHRVGGRIACGAGTDQMAPDLLPPGSDALDVITEAYLEQVKIIEAADATVIVMASRDLARTARSAEDYLTVYDQILQTVTAPVILHWLGPAFDPALAGYWGCADRRQASDTVLRLIERHAAKVDGIKVSLLDADHERDLRRRLPSGVRLYTGDDFNYPELVCGDEQGHSDALLGILAAIAPAAATALQALDDGHPELAREVLESTREFGRHIFGAPTFYYKTGIAYLAWLNGHQSGFQMVGGLTTGRSVAHLVRTFVLADRAGLVTEPELAARRMTDYLTVAGVQPRRAR